MAIGSQPTVLDRLKERLVVALGKSQDKRVKHAQSKNYFCRDQQKIFQVQCGLGRIEDQLPPPCSPARRPRSASICRYFNFIFQRILLHWWFIFHIGVSFFFFLSVSLPDTKQIVQESLGQVRIRIIVVVGVDVKRNQIIFILTSFSKKFHRI